MDELRPPIERFRTAIEEKNADVHDANRVIGKGLHTLYLLDVTYQGTGQISAVHEMGHAIGLRHPGDSGADDEYSTDEPSLMGLGMEIRAMYFVSWAVKRDGWFPGQAPFTPSRMARH